jgi:CMP-N,N'-diacetyllegionaminic acid synthase
MTTPSQPIALSCVAFIPARSGSKRVVGKNAKLLGNKPLLAYTIQVALQSECFSRVIVSTEAPEMQALALQYGAEVPFLRPAHYATDASPDCEWLLDALHQLATLGPLPDAVAILRPTSPFRTVAMLHRAWAQFTKAGRDIDSLRAVEPVQQHPAKQWQLTPNGLLMHPVMPNPDASTTPWHSMPLQQLPPVYVQNASLELAWTTMVMHTKTLAGQRIAPFITQGYEGFDINTPNDWWLAEQVLLSGELPYDD